MRAEELGERVFAAIVNENSGNYYHRINVIRERGLDAIFYAAEHPSKICSFKNKHGWCKLSENHSGSHTVIFLGNDE